MAMTATRPTAPWYRQPWPWILMLGPAVVVVASSYSAWLAVSGADGLIADDYYTEGLAINHQIARDMAAERLGLGAQARVTAGNILAVEVKRETPGEFSAVLTLHMVHHTRSGVDQTITLHKAAPNLYEGKLDNSATGLWNVALEGTDWRLTGQWQAPFDRGVALRPGG
jgi:hypothetical protein